MSRGGRAAAVLAEWTKLRSVRSELAAMVAVAVLMIAGTVLVVAGMDLPECVGACLDNAGLGGIAGLGGLDGGGLGGAPASAGSGGAGAVGGGGLGVDGGGSGGGCPDGAGAPAGCPAADGTLTLVGVHFAQLAVIVLAVAGMAGEFQPRLLRVTFAMRPGRVGVFGAKAAVVAGAVVVSAAVGVPAAVVAGRMVLEHRTGIAADGPPARAVAGTVVYLVLIGLLSLGVAAATRSGPVASGVVVAGLYGPYLLTLLVPLPAGTLHAIQDASPLTAGLAVQAAVAGTGTAPIGPWAGLGVLAAYAGGCLLLGGALLRGRDA